MPDSNDVDLTIRAAEAADAEALADLMTQLGYETRTSEMQMRMEAILSNKNYATFVAVNAVTLIDGATRIRTDPAAALDVASR